MLTKDSSASQPLHPSATPELVMVLGCAATAFVTVALLVHWQLTDGTPESGWAGAADGFAFPSGHAASATAGYLVLAVHWSTDVIAGWALGTAIAAATLLATLSRADSSNRVTTTTGRPR
jgi:membrane-associated phospholipid phosphatase